jgi:alkyldihydroxyacetonephosphate synthase
VSLGASAGSSWRRHRYDGPYLRDELLDAGYLVETVETAAHWRRVPQVHQRVGAAVSRALGVDGRRAYVMCHISHVYETGASLYFTAIVAAGADAPGQWLAAKRAATDAMVESGATITHHHAVGRDHQPWLDDEIGPGGVAILTAVKSALDPNGVMNPGVLVPAASAQAGTGEARAAQLESTPG